MATTQWISKELLENALQRFLNNESVRIVDFTKSDITTSGESYCSALMRTTVTYQIPQKKDFQTIAVLGKRPPDTKQALRFTIELNYFKKEIEMFQITLPEFRKILGDAGNVSAKCIYAQTEPFPLVIVEDVTPLGFKMLNRREGLDLEHCLCVVRKLAQFHTASLILHDRNPKAFDNYSESMFWGKPIVLEWMELAVQAIINSSRNFPALQKYANKLERIRNKIPERAAAASKLRSGGFNVLNHGDPWTNNFLFCYDELEKKVKDMILVDYQVVVYGSPAIDLHYFWATSPTTEVRNKHLNKVLEYYYEQLIVTLNKLHFEPVNLPSIEELKDDWLSSAYYGLVAGITITPLIKCDNREDANFEHLFAPDQDFVGSFQHHVYNNSISLKHLENVLSFFDRLGIFDY